MTAAHSYDQVVHNDDDAVHSTVHSAPSRDEAAAARLAWEVAVDQLVRPGQYSIRREDGGRETAEVLPLLRQVQEAVTPGSKVSGKTVLGSRPPASLGALALLADIRSVVRQCCRAHGHPIWKTLTDQVSVWVAHADDWQHTAPDYVVFAAERASDWVRAARLMLDPEPRYPLRGRACPICRTSAVQVWSDDEADWVRRPALSIDPDHADAVCASCGQRWGLDVWAQLNATLDQQLAHETLALP